MKRYLVNTERANAFLELLATDIGRKARLGDTEKMEEGARPYALAAQFAIRDAVTNIGKLANDKTRTEVAQHEMGRKVAIQAVEAVTKARNDIAARVDALNAQSMDAVATHFANHAPGEGMAARISGWIADTLKSPEGIAKVKQAAAEDQRVAAVIHNEPMFLTGISDTLRKNIIADTVDKQLPETAEQLVAADALSNLLNRYDDLASKIHENFYSAHLANEAHSRVEL